MKGGLIGRVSLRGKIYTICVCNDVEDLFEMYYEQAKHKKVISNFLAEVLIRYRVRKPRTRDEWDAMMSDVLSILGV